MRLRRHGLVVLLTVVILVAPPIAEAQPSKSVWRIGLLTDSAWEPLRERLRDLGYAQGKNIVFEPRQSEGRAERWPALALELVRLNVDVLVTQGTPATLAAKRATTTIPIVMVGTGDPLTSGLVASLAHPSGNVTGSTQLGVVAGSQGDCVRTVSEPSSGICHNRSERLNGAD